jgi:tellurite resistance protein
MQPHVEAMVKSLVAVAWADGRLHRHEQQLIEALLSAFEVDTASASALRSYAGQPRSLEDIPLNELSADDRRLLLQHAVLLTYVDGEQSAEERELLHVLAHRLRVPDREAKPLLESAARRAERLKTLLA